MKGKKMTDNDYYGPYGSGTAHLNRMAEETALRAQNLKNTLVEIDRVSRKSTSDGFSNSNGKSRSGGTSLLDDFLSIFF